MACANDGCSQPSASSREDVNVCAVCVRSLRDPRLLSCLHSFCCECVDNLTVAAEQRFLNCPACQAKTTLDVNGAASLAKDLTKKSGRTQKCSGCWPEGKDRMAPTAWCGRCAEAFCSNHALPHQFSSGHTVTALAEGGHASSGNSNGKATPGPQLCADHREPLKFYCEKCEVLVCGDCSLVGSHCRHTPIVLAKDVQEERQEAVLAKVEKLMNELVPRKEKALKAVEDVAGDLARHADQARAIVRSSGERLVNIVNTLVEQFLQDINGVEKTRSEVLHGQRDELTRDIDAMKTAVAVGDAVKEQSIVDPDGDMTSVLLALEKRVNGLLRGNEEQTPRSHSRLRFKANLDEENILQQAKSMIGRVNFCEVSANSCVVLGEFSRSCSLGKTVAFSVEARDVQGRKIIPGDEDQLIANWAKLPMFADRSLKIDVSKQDDGIFIVSWALPVVGEYLVQMTIDGEKLPTMLSARAISLMFDPNMCQPDLVLSADRKKVTHSQQLRWSFVTATTVMKRGSYTWTARVENPAGKKIDHLVGIVVRRTAEEGKLDERGLFHNSYRWDNSSHVRVAGSDDTRATALPRFHDGDYLQLELNCDLHRLYITNLRTNEKASISNLPEAEFLPYFCLYYHGSSFTLLS